jgi:hypothetical protein
VVAPIKLSGKYLDSVASDPTLDHIQTIRIGSKSLAYWPYKYVTDDDADDLMVRKRTLFGALLLCCCFKSIKRDDHFTKTGSGQGKRV